MTPLNGASFSPIRIWCAFGAVYATSLTAGPWIRARNALMTLFRTPSLGFRYSAVYRNPSSLLLYFRHSSPYPTLLHILHHFPKPNRTNPLHYSPLIHQRPHLIVVNQPLPLFASNSNKSLPQLLTTSKTRLLLSHPTMPKYSIYPTLLPATHSHSTGRSETPLPALQPELHCLPLPIPAGVPPATPPYSR